MAAAVLNRVAGAGHGELQGTYLLVLCGTGAVLPESGPLRNRAGRGRADLAARAPLVEALGTASPVLVIFGRSDPDNAAAPEPSLAPFFVGFTVAVLISLFAPLTQAGWNPARDFGPRLVALLAGYGSIASPGPGDGFWIYLLGPLLGGPLGSLRYERLVRPNFPRKLPTGV